MPTFITMHDILKQVAEKSQIKDINSIHVEADTKIKPLQGPLFVCAERPKSFSHYDNIDRPDFSTIENYQIFQKLGCGGYSEVYQGVNIENNQKCVIKVLKPVKIERQFREIKILQTLYGGPNIVKLYDIIRAPVTRTPGLVFEYIPS